MLIAIILSLVIVTNAINNDVYVLVDNNAYLLTSRLIDLFNKHQIKALFIYNITKGDIVYHQIMLAKHFIVTLDQFVANIPGANVLVVDTTDFDNFDNLLTLIQDQIYHYKSLDYIFPLWQSN